MTLMRRCHELDIHNVYIKCHLFDALVRPVMNFRCEVWGPAALSNGDDLISSSWKEVERLLA